jgi:hypothetical protein
LKSWLGGIWEVECRRWRWLFDLCFLTFEPRMDVVEFGVVRVAINDSVDEPEVIEK